MFSFVGETIPLLVWLSAAVQHAAEQLNTWSERLELRGASVVVSEDREVLAVSGQRHCQAESGAGQKSRSLQVNVQVNYGTLNGQYRNKYFKNQSAYSHLWYVFNISLFGWRIKMFLQVRCFNDLLLMNNHCCNHSFPWRLWPK